MERRDSLLDGSSASLYRSLAVAPRCAAEPPVETIDTRQQETIDNDRAFDLLIGVETWGSRG